MPNKGKYKVSQSPTYSYPLNLEPTFKWVGSRIPGYRGQGGDKPGSSRKPGYFHKCLLVIQMRPKSHIGIEALVLDTSSNQLLSILLARSAVPEI